MSISNGYRINNQFMVWCQGESDGDRGVSGAQYQTQLINVVDEIVAQGLERCYVIRIGNHRSNPELYQQIILAQTQLCKAHPYTTLVSTKFAAMAANGMMRDSFHYTQEGYNIAGTDAGINTAFHIINKKEPMLYDPEYDNVYFPFK